MRTHLVPLAASLPAMQVCSRARTRSYGSQRRASARRCVASASGAHAGLLLPVASHLAVPNRAGSEADVERDPRDYHSRDDGHSRIRAAYRARSAQVGGTWLVALAAQSSASISVGGTWMPLVDGRQSTTTPLEFFAHGPFNRLLFRRPSMLRRCAGVMRRKSRLRRFSLPSQEHSRDAGSSSSLATLWQAGTGAPLRARAFLWHGSLAS